MLRCSLPISNSWRFILVRLGASPERLASPEPAHVISKFRFPASQSATMPSENYAAGAAEVAANLSQSC